MSRTSARDGCPTCGGDLSLIDLAPDTSFGRCRRCALITSTQIDAGEALDVYRSGAYADSAEGTQFTDTARLREQLAVARTRLRWLEQHHPGRSLLDVGAAGGVFVRAALDAGFEAMGLEPAPAFADFARDHLDVEIALGTVEDADLPPASFDVATLWHVLEHIPRPTDTLQAIRRLLRPGGLIAIEVPNIESAMARRLGPEWSGLQPEVHVNHFGPSSLVSTLEAAGFAMVEVVTVGHAVYVGRMRRFLDPRFIAHQIQFRQAGLHGRSGPSGYEYLRALAHVPTG